MECAPALEEFKPMQIPERRQYATNAEIKTQPL
jgi:hypothetical protein